MNIIIGAGLAGLACAGELARAGRPYLLLEKAQRVGGRVGSLFEHGFTFDLGFQVILDSYPAVREMIDIPALRPCLFEPGAIIWDQGRIFEIRRPAGADRMLAAISSEVFSWTDKARFAAMLGGICLQQDQTLLREDPGLNVADYLRGFSQPAIERFFRPFFGGVFLDNELQTSAALFRYYLKKFATGETFVPERGIQAMPEQLLGRLNPEYVRLGCTVEGLDIHQGMITQVKLGSGETLPCEKLVLACGQPASAQLLGLQAKPGSTVSVLYWSASRSLYSRPMLVLPAGKNRLLRHFVQITNIAPSYAPANQHLISGTILSDQITDSEVDLAAEEIGEVFPSARGHLTFLKKVSIGYGTPRQERGQSLGHRFARPLGNLWLVGDQISHASIQGALDSGRSAGLDLLAVPPRLSAAA